MIKKIEPGMIDVPENIVSKWQDLVNIIAKLANIPSGLIMRIAKEDITVFISSQTKGNPYHPGDKEHLANSGLYCETVIKTKQQLLVPDALKDPEWKNNPDVKLNMISYLGFPIMLPDDTPFGTICILDNKENAYTETIVKIIEKFRDMIQTHLALLYMNAVLGEKNKQLTDYLDELQSLRGLIPICACCKKIKDNKGYWNAVETYLIKHPEADFTHGYCPECYKEFMDQLESRVRP